MAMQAGYLSVTVEFGKDLASRDMICRQDPYCTVKCGSQMLRTHTHRNGGRNPVWNQTLKFQVVNENDVDIVIYDEDTFTRDDIIGTARMSLVKARQQGIDQAACPVIGKKQKQRGFITVRVVFAALAPPASQQTQYVAATTTLPYPSTEPYVPQYMYAAPYAAAPHTAPPPGCYLSQPASAYTSQPAPAYSSQPAPAYPSQPTWGYPWQPAPAYPSQPAPAYPSQPAPVYPSPPAPAYPLPPAPAYPSQPAPAYASQPAPAYPAWPAPAHAPSPAWPQSAAVPVY